MMPRPPRPAARSAFAKLCSGWNVRLDTLARSSGLGGPATATRLAARRPCLPKSSFNAVLCE